MSGTSVKIYVDLTERWPAYDITTTPDPAFSTAHEIPAELWDRYCSAGRTYWAAEREILDLAGIKEDDL